MPIRPAFAKSHNAPPELEAVMREAELASRKAMGILLDGGLKLFDALPDRNLPLIHNGDHADAYAIHDRMYSRLHYMTHAVQRIGNVTGERYLRLAQLSRRNVYGDFTKQDYWDANPSLQREYEGLLLEFAKEDEP